MSRDVRIAPRRRKQSYRSIYHTVPVRKFRDSVPAIWPDYALSVTAKKYPQLEEYCYTCPMLKNGVPPYTAQQLPSKG